MAGKHPERCFFIFLLFSQLPLQSQFLFVLFSLCISLLPQYFEYTSQKEIRFNTVTELCAEVLEGKVSVGMRHCPRDSESRPAHILWEFRQVHLPFIRKERESCN